jgi:hypothetical protein
VFEANLAAEIQVLQVGKGGYVAGDNLVAYKLFKLGEGNLQGSIDLVTGFVKRHAV